MTPNPTATLVHVVAPFGRELARRRVPAGCTIGELQPQVRADHTGTLLIAKLNGGPKFVSRKDWHYRLQPGDILEWLEVPSGGKDDAGFLQVLLAFAASIITENPAPILLAFASQAVQFFIDTPRPEEQRDIAPTYATGLQGNGARLYAPVPKICGRHLTYPPFASQPYQEFDANGDQYLYVILALGIGNHDVERVLIDDTPIQHFSDVLTCEYLPPGTGPTVAKTSVINAPEVAGQDMLTGQVIGGFAACGPRQRAAAIGIDIQAPRGLGVQDSAGDLSALEVRWRVEIAEVNEFGTRVTPWTNLTVPYVSETAANREPQRWSYYYELDTPIRCEIRVIRMDVKSANVHSLNDLVWTGMRAYLDDDSVLHPDVAHFEVVMRASRQLSNVSQGRIAVIATGKCRTIQADGTFGAEIATRNPAHWLADLWTSTTWGEGLAVSQVDMDTLYDLSQVWEQRQDHFDYVFDSAVDADTAAQLIAEAGRARAFRRGGVRTLARDQLVTVPRTAFHTRNTLPGTMQKTERLPRDDEPDGVVVEYWNYRSWNYGDPIVCPVPGLTPAEVQRPVRVRLAGITGSMQAKREGYYRAARMALRRITVEATTEMQGSLPAFGSLVRWQSEVTSWRAGDVVEWNQETLTARLTEPPPWASSGGSPFYIVLIRDNGTPTDPIEVTPGGLATEVILAEDPGFTPSTEDGTRDRTQYMLGSLEEDQQMVKMGLIGDGGQQDGAQLLKIAGFVDDDRVHTADIAFLPSPGETQDPIDDTPSEPGGGTVPVVNVTNHDLTGMAQTGDPVSWVEFRNTGELYGHYEGDFSGSFDGVLPDEWLFGAPAEATVTALFEVRATVYSGGTLSTGTFGSWLALDTTRRWEAAIGEGATVLFELRDVATETVQDTALITIAAVVISV